MSAASGWAVDLFTDAVHDFLLCGKCHKVINDPRNCPHGHTFCKHCIETSVRDGGVCPVDGAAVTLDRLAKNIPVQCMLGQLTLKCPNVGDGCEWTGKLDTLASHADECRFTRTTCRFEGCSLMFTAADMPAHAMVCPSRLVACSFCGTEVAFTELGTHHATTCTDILVPCPNGCSVSEAATTAGTTVSTGAGAGVGAGAGTAVSTTEVAIELDAEDGTVPRELDPVFHVKRSGLAAHLEACPATPVECSFAYIGCKEKRRRGDIKAHEQDPVHMTLLLKETASIRRKLGLEAPSDSDSESGAEEGKDDKEDKYVPVWDPSFNHVGSLDFLNGNSRVESNSGHQGLVTALHPLPSDRPTSWAVTVINEKLSDACVTWGVLKKPVSSNNYQQSNVWSYRAYNGQLYEQSTAKAKITKPKLNEPVVLTYEPALGKLTMTFGAGTPIAAFTNLPADAQLYPCANFYGSSSTQRTLDISAADGVTASIPANPSMALVFSQLAELRRTVAASAAATASSGAVSGAGSGSGAGAATAAPGSPVSFPHLNGSITQGPVGTLAGSGNCIAMSDAKLAVGSCVSYTVVADKDSDQVLCFGFAKSGASSSTSYDSSNRWFYRCYNGQLYGASHGSNAPVKLKTGETLTLTFKADGVYGAAKLNSGSITEIGKMWDMPSSDVYPAVAIYGGSGRSTKPSARVTMGGSDTEVSVLRAEVVELRMEMAAMRTMLMGLAAGGSAAALTLDTSSSEGGGSVSVAADGVVSATGVTARRFIPMLSSTAVTRWTVKVIKDHNNDERSSYGITTALSTGYEGSNKWTLRCYNGALYGSGSSSAWSNMKVHPGDSINFEFDPSAAKLRIGVNSSAMGTAFTGLPSTGMYAFAVTYGSADVKYQAIGSSALAPAASSAGDGSSISFLTSSSVGGVSITEGNKGESTSSSALFVSDKVITSGTATWVVDCTKDTSGDEAICIGVVDPSTAALAGGKYDKKGYWMLRAFNGQVYVDGSQGVKRASVKPGTSVTIKVDFSTHKITWTTPGDSPVGASFSASSLTPVVSMYSSGRIAKIHSFKG